MKRQCDCISEFQDKTNGRGIRIMNICKKNTACRCTICRKEYPLTADEIKRAKLDKDSKDE